MARPVALFAPETFNIAETTRMIEVAKAARERFEPVFMGYGGEFARLVAEAGFAYRELEPRYAPEKIAWLWKIDRMEAFGDPFRAEELRRRVAGELGLYRELKPAVVTIGFTLSVYLSARLAGIPLVAVTPFSFTRPFFRAGLGTFPDQFRRGPLALLPARLADAAMSRWALRTKAWIGPLNRVAKERGHPGFGSLLESWEADRMLVAEIPEVTGVPDLPPGWSYVGPIFARLPGALPPEALAAARRRPLVYCAMGCSANAAVAREVVEAFAGSRFTLLAPMRAHLGRDFAGREGLALIDWLPALEANAMADIAVIHGGHGTVQTACAAGTPFLGIGMQPEQEWNIDFLVRAGAARRLGRQSLSRLAILESAEALLADESARSAAHRIREAYRARDGAREAAEILAREYG